MDVPRRFFRFFIYSNVFIACCAVLMVWQTCTLLLGSAPPWPLVSFVFFATICSYSFHWYFTPVDSTIVSERMEWLRSNRQFHLILLVAGLTGAVVSACFLLKHWEWLALSAVVTFLYSAPKIPHRWFRSLRKVAIGKTLFLAFTWAYVTSILPLQIAGNHWATDFTLFAVHRFTLIYAICILFDYRDRDYDQAVGIRSLVTWLSERGIVLLFYLTLFVFTLSTILLALFSYPIPAVLVLLLPGVITGLLYKTARRNTGDRFYYFFLDGLMALSALIMLISQL